jgi:hypothetical protein
MKKSILFLIIIYYSSFTYLNGQNNSATFNPKVFLVGENDENYAEVTKNYEESLLSVSNDSMDVAYLNWMWLMKDIEDYAKKTNYDVNGLKIWLNVFWNKSGKIEVISYYPKPNCKNIEFEKFSLFIIDFMKNYKPRLHAKLNFAHYGSAKFPSYADMYLSEDK